MHDHNVHPRFGSRGYAYAALAGVALALSAAPQHWPALAFLAPAFLLLAVDSVEGSPKKAFFVGWLAGAVANAIALYWIAGLLESFAGFPWFAAMPVAGLLFLAQGLTFALASGCAGALIAKGFPGWLVLPSLLTVCFAWMPGLFPWHPCVPLVSWTEWAQLAEVGSEPLLDLLWGLAGCGLAEGLRRLPSRHAVGPLLVGCLCIVLPYGYGSIRIEQIRAERNAGTSILVGVVQPNVGILDKHDPAQAGEHLRELQQATQRLEEAGAVLTVWPESSYPYPIPRGATRDGRGALSVRGTHLRHSILFGAITSRSRCERYNSVIAMQADGSISGVSDKVELLAFGEYVPLWDEVSWLHHWFPCRGFVAGQRPKVLSIENQRIGVLNCYEDVLSKHARIVALENVDFLVNTTNDAWFGDSSEPFLHHQFARLRSIETRRDLIRAVNTGVSGHILATGEDAIHTGTFVNDAFVADVRSLTSRSVWTRFGDVLTPMLWTLLLGLVFASRHWESKIR